ncbi:MAG: serine/threonine-protein kinase [Phycisphaerae bacterium]
MSADRHRRVSDIFLAAVDLAPAERAKLLERSCGDDAALRREVEELLDRDSRPARVDSAAVGTAFRGVFDHARTDADALPRSIGRYEILGLLGQGGMGVVFRARQSNPRRDVALKVLHAALVTPELCRRFEFEASVLARLTSPGIAQIYEADVVREHGRLVPYFAMELVEGAPLTQYADEHGLGVRDRLQLMLRVCDAVSYAHQKGVIHRDLKPANILVSVRMDEVTRTRGRGGEVQDARACRRGHSNVPERTFSLSSVHACPKILDFGVACAMDSEWAVTRQTGAGQLIGTLPYMSPEQVAGDAGQIDTRSDVYALGVIAFELLAGRLPFELSGLSLTECIDRLRTNDAPRLGLLRNSLRGDIETIVAKALERDKERRYASVTALAADIERSLRDEPISARPPTVLYQIRKFTRRNRILVGSAAAVVLALTSGVVATTWQAVVATRSEARAVKLAVRESAARERAEAETRKATEIKSFLQWMLRSASQSQGRGANFTVREALDEAAARIDTEFGGFPEIRMELQATIGLGYKGLGLSEKAEPLLRASLDTRRALLGPQHPDLVQPMWDLALVLRYSGQYEEAEALLKEAHSIAIARLGHDSSRAAGLQSSLALLRLKMGDRIEAQRLLDECVADGANSRSADSISAKLRLARARATGQDFAAAAAAWRDVLAACDAAGPNAAPSTRTFALNQLAQNLAARNRCEEAARLFRVVLDRQVHAVGADAPRVTGTKVHLATCLLALGERSEALTMGAEARAELLAERKYDDAVVLESCHNLGRFYEELSDGDAAEAVYRRGLTIGAQFPPDPETLIIARRLAAVLVNSGHESDAEGLLREVIAVAESNVLADHWQLALCRRTWGNCLRRGGRFAAAETQLLAARAVVERVYGADHAWVRVVARDLVQLYEQSGQQTKAEALRTPAHRASRPADDLPDFDEPELP